MVKIIKRMLGYYYQSKKALKVVTFISIVLSAAEITSNKENNESETSTKNKSKV